MRAYDLFEKEYGTRGGYRVLKGLRLTPSGHRVLHDGDGEVPVNEPQENTKEVTIDSWKADAALLQARYPEFEVIYDIRLRKM